MFKRRRRAARCRVEALEGRAAPSIVFVTAHIPSGKGRELEIEGTTFPPTVPGNRVVITVEYQHNMMGKVHRVTREVEVSRVRDPVSPNQGSFKLKLTANGTSTWKTVHELDPVTVASLFPKTDVVKESTGNLVVTIR